MEKEMKKPWMKQEFKPMKTKPRETDKVLRALEFEPTVERIIRVTGLDVGTVKSALKYLLDEQLITKHYHEDKIYFKVKGE